MSERVLLLPDGPTALRKVDWQTALYDALLSVDTDSGAVVAAFWEYVTDPAYDLDRGGTGEEKA